MSQQTENKEAVKSESRVLCLGGVQRVNTIVESSYAYSHFNGCAGAQTRAAPVGDVHCEHGY